MGAVLKQDTDSSDIGIQWIQRKRAEGLSTTAIAEILGVRPQAIFQCKAYGKTSPRIQVLLYEKGLMPLPTVEKAQRWHSHFNRQAVMKKIGLTFWMLLSLHKLVKHFWGEVK